MSLLRPLRVLGDGLFENGRRVTAKPFSCDTLKDFVFMELCGVFVTDKLWFSGELVSQSWGRFL